jgi:hypothetical protein
MVQPDASHASARSFHYDFSLIPVRAGMPSRQPQRADNSPGGIGRREAGDARTPPIVNDVLASPGDPLQAESRAMAEPLFRHDFAHVRVHADRRAAESARALHASAYTVGRHVVFGAGESPAHVASSRNLLLHELAHTIQQQHAVSDGAPLRVSQPGDADERQADAAVRAVLNGAPIPTLGTSSAHVARQPRTTQGAAAKDEAGVDTFAGAEVSQITVWLSRKRVAFQTSRGWVYGDVNTDLTEGSYELKPEIRQRKWVITKPAVQAGRRFSVDLEGAIPWTLSYPATLPLTVTSGSPTTEGEIRDPYGMGYNTIYKNAGPTSKAAVLALAALETPRLFIDLDAYKKLDAPVRKSILALEPHAAGTACHSWFDVMRANDPDFKPTYTPEQIREGMAAYYSSTREAAQQKKVESAKAELPTLDPVQIEAKWKDNKYGLVSAAQTPNHGIKAEALHAIWSRYWSDKYKLAEDVRQSIRSRESKADFDAYFRKLNEYEGGDHTALGPDYAKADAVIALGDLMFRHSPDVLTICRFADAQGTSLTLDQLNDRVLAYAKVHDPMVQSLELALMFGRGGVDPVSDEPVKTDPVKTDPVKSDPVKTDPVKADPVKTDPVKTEAGGDTAKTEQGAEGGTRVVAGRAVKPRIATATRYVWSNPRMAKGNFVEADLDANGALEVTVKSHGPDELRVGGSKMLDDVFDHFGADNIHEFDAKWVRNSSFTENFSEYTRNLQNNMKPEEAAWNTWTGRQLKARGFTKVEVPAHGEDPDIVSPVFKK